MSTQVSWFRQLLGWLILFVSLLLFVSLSKGIFELLSVYDRVQAVEEEVTRLEEEREGIRRQLERQQTESFVEQQIRDKLHLAKPGEVVVVLPEGSVPLKTHSYDEGIEEENPNWKKWLELFWY
jgi:cell division protein FtsB